MILSIGHAYNILVLSDQSVVIVFQRSRDHFPYGRGLAIHRLKGRVSFPNEAQN